MTDSNKLLIVGGTGFIGNQLVRDAIKLDYQVTVLSLNELAAEKRNNAAHYIRANMASYDELEKALAGQKFNYVINLGGYINHAKYLDGGRAVMDIHLAGVQNLVHCLDWAPLKSFVQIGSSDEYGSHPAPQAETLPEMPVDAYAMGKVAANQLLLMLHRSENFPAIIIRLFLVYGPGQDEKRFLPQVISGCMNDEYFPVSHGEQLRDFCYVNDISSGILTAMTCSRAHGEVINLAAGEPVTVKSVINGVREIIGQGVPEYGKIAYRMGENMSLYADISKAKEIFLWTPEVSMKEGLKRTINYFREKNC